MKKTIMDTECSTLLCIMSSNHKGSPCFPKVDQKSIWPVLNSKIYCAITVWAMLVPELLLVQQKNAQHLCNGASNQVSASALLHRIHLKGEYWELITATLSLFDSQTQDLISWWEECWNIPARMACSFMSTSLFQYRSSCITGFRRVWIFTWRNLASLLFLFCFSRKTNKKPPPHFWASLMSLNQDDCHFSS